MNITNNNSNLSLLYNMMIDAQGNALFPSLFPFIPLDMTTRVYGKRKLESKLNTDRDINKSGPLSLTALERYAPFTIFTDRYIAACLFFHLLC